MRPNEHERTSIKGHHTHALKPKLIRLFLSLSKPHEVVDIEVGKVLKLSYCTLLGTQEQAKEYLASRGNIYSIQDRIRMTDRLWCIIFRQARPGPRIKMRTRVNSWLTMNVLELTEESHTRLCCARLIRDCFYKTAWMVCMYNTVSCEVVTDLLYIARHSGRSERKSHVLSGKHRNLSWERRAENGDGEPRGASKPNKQQTTNSLWTWTIGAEPELLMRAL